MALATVQRLRKERAGVRCLPFVEHRTRDLAVLIAGTEWGWSEDPREAFVFRLRDLPPVRRADDWEISAVAHVEWLKEKCGETCTVFVCDFGGAAEQARALKQASALRVLTQSVDEAHEAVEQADGTFGLHRQAAVRRRSPRRRSRPVAPSVAPERVYEETCHRLGEDDR